MAAMAHMAILGVQELGLLGVLVKQLLWVYTSLYIRIPFFYFSVEARYGWYKRPWFLQMVPEIKSGSIQCQGCFVRFEICKKVSSLHIMG